jgi:hypothetical protein
LDVENLVTDIKKQVLRSDNFEPFMQVLKGLKGIKSENNAGEVWTMIEKYVSEITGYA